MRRNLRQGSFDGQEAVSTERQSHISLASTDDTAMSERRMALEESRLKNYTTAHKPLPPTEQTRTAVSAEHTAVSSQGASASLNEEPSNEEPVVAAANRGTGFWRALGSNSVGFVRWAYRGSLALGAAAGKALVNPDTYIKAASLASQALSAMAETAKLALSSRDYALGLLTSAARGTWHFLKEMSQSLGLTDLGAGLFKLCSLPYRCAVEAGHGLLHAGSALGQLIKGDISLKEFGKTMSSALAAVSSVALDSLKGSLQAIKGGGKLLLEATGLADAYRAVMCLAQGDFKGFMFNAAFAALSLGTMAVTVLTAGGGVPLVALVMMLRTSAKTVVKTAAKVALEKSAEAIGEAVIKKAGAKLAGEAAREVAGGIANQALKDLEKHVAKHGAESLVTGARTVCGKLAEKEVGKMLEKAGVKDLVADQTFKLLKDIDKKSVGKLASEFEQLGFAKGEAREAAKLLKKGLLSGQGEREISQILEDGITKKLRAHLEKEMEDAFKKRFREGLAHEAEIAGRGEKSVLGSAIRDRAKKEGIEISKCIDDVVDSGWKGFKEGMEKAIRRIVREGIKEGFERFRKSKRHHRSAPVNGAAATTGTLLDGPEPGANQEAGQGKDRNTKLEDAQTSRGPLKEYSRVEYDEGAGADFRNTYQLIDGKEVRIAHAQVGVAAVAQAKKKEQEERKAKETKS